MGTGQLTPGNGGDCRRGGTVAGKQVYYSLHNFYYILSLFLSIHVLSLMAHTQFLRDYSPIGQPTNIIHAQCLSTDRTILATASVETGHITADSVQ